MHKIGVPIQLFALVYPLNGRYNHEVSDRLSQLIEIGKYYNDYGYNDIVIREVTGYVNGEITLGKVVVNLD